MSTEKRAKPSGKSVPWHLQTAVQRAKGRARVRAWRERHPERVAELNALKLAAYHAAKAKGNLSATSTNNQNEGTK
jgi:hypothetical protein